MEEIWKDVVGYEGLYSASNLGNIRGVKRLGSTGGVLKAATRKDGYMQVSLRKDGDARSFLAHRLIAEAFIGFNDVEKYVNHIDGDRKNNKLTNLEVCTMKHNNTHRSEVLGKNTKPVICVETGEVFQSIRLAGREKGIGNKEISLCCRNIKRYKTAGGYHWEYLNPEGVDDNEK